MNKKGYDNISSGDDKLVGTVCTICELKFSSEIELNKHMNWCKYFCSICEKSFESSQLYKHHRCKRLFCEECIQFFNTDGELAEHMKTHSAPIYCVIPSCRENTFTSQLMLRDHIFNKHTKQVKFRNGKTPWVCLLDGFSHICSGHYNGRFKILRHISSVANYKPFNCPECPKSFCVEYRLNEHLRKVHSVVRQSWTCCGKEFEMKSLFRVHAKTFCPMNGRLATINFRNLNTAEIQVKIERLKTKRFKSDVRKKIGSSSVAAVGKLSECITSRTPKLAVAQCTTECFSPPIRRGKKRKAGAANIGNVVSQAPNMSAAGFERLNTSSLPNILPTRGRPRSMAVTKMKELAYREPSSEETQFLWEELPRLAFPNYKSQKNIFCKKLPIAFSKDENLHFKSSNSDHKSFICSKFSPKSLSDREISAKIKSPLSPCLNKYRYKLQPFKNEAGPYISTSHNDELPKLSVTKYHLSKPMLLQTSDAHRPILLSSGLCPSKEGEDKFSYDLPLLGDLKSETSKINSTKLLKNKQNCPRGIKVIQTNHLHQKSLNRSLMYKSSLDNSPTLKPKMCKSDIKTQLELAEKKLQTIRSLVNGWKVKGTMEDIQVLLKEIDRNL
jgi:hypothetical protein